MEVEPLDCQVMELLGRTSTATLTTELFSRGFRKTFLSGVRPLNPAAARFVGEAFTVGYIPARRRGLRGMSTKSATGLAAPAVDRRFVLLNLEDRLDLNRDAHRERGHTDCGAGVLPGTAEHFEDEVRESIDDGRLLREVRHAIHHPQYLDHTGNAVQ